MSTPEAVCAVPAASTSPPGRSGGTTVITGGTFSRPFPDWMYAYPDARNRRIAELEAALLESNDTAARYADLIKILTLQVELLRRMSTP